MKAVNNALPSRRTLQDHFTRRPRCWVELMRRPLLQTLIVCNCHVFIPQNLTKEVNRVCKFLNQSYSEIELSRLAQYLSFDSLRKNKSVNNTTDEGDDAVQFIRKGMSRFIPMLINIVSGLCDPRSDVLPSNVAILLNWIFMVTLANLWIPIPIRG